MGKKLSVAFAGVGDVERENVFALLDDQLTAWDETYDDVLFVVPESPKRGHKAMQHVKAFLEDDEVGLTEEDYDELVETYTDAKDAVVMTSRGDDRLLILAPKLDEEGSADELTEELMELAAEHEVPVKDMTHSLDDLLFEEDDDSPAEDDTQEKAQEETEEAPEKPRKRRSRPQIDEGRQETMDDLKALREAREAAKDGSHPSDETPEETAEGFVRNREAADEAQALLLPTNAAVSIGEQIEILVRQIVSQEIDRRAQAKVEEKKAAADSQEIVEFYKDEEGNLRKKGRGRPRKGEETVSMSKLEALEQGLLEDDD